MPTREIYGAKRVDILFSISGIGNFSYGWIAVQSDTANILVNTFSIQGYTFGEQTTYLGELGPPKINETKTAYVTIEVPSTELPKNTQLNINGHFQIETSGMTIGTYRLKVIFLIQQDNEFYSFEDSIQYRIIGLFEAYPTLHYVIFFLIFIVAPIIANLIMKKLRFSEKI